MDDAVHRLSRLLPRRSHDLLVSTGPPDRYHSQRRPAGGGREMFPRQKALDRIGQLYGVEDTITGMPPDHRRGERQQRSKPIAAALAAWADETVR